MATEAVRPLRITKMTPTSSPSKPRPLSEISSTERRRNSPSYNQATRKMIVTKESSPFDASAFRSPRAFWNREDSNSSMPRHDIENSPERSPSPSKRSSIENLKKASRVANSPMFARENRDKYDPLSSPDMCRPLTDRPLSDRVQQNPFTRLDGVHKENNPFKASTPGHQRARSKIDIAETFGPTVASHASQRAQSPLASPVKSSMTTNARYGPSTTGGARDSPSPNEEDVSGLHTPRHSLRPAKSVTFESAPPERHEYEQQTPEPSSIASTSRESSYESDDYEYGTFDREASAGDEDSFDASLEDTAKTPVVLPGDWRHASPETARTELVDEHDDVFDDGVAGSPAPNAFPGRLLQQPAVSVRCESVASDDSQRPLPPIPGIHSPGRGRRSSGSLTAAAERASSQQRTAPSTPRPASVSKGEILRMREAAMSLEDRMNLMALQANNATERRESSQSARPSSGSPSKTTTAPAAQDLPDLDKMPTISRESILRQVKSERSRQLLDEPLDFVAEYDEPRDYAELAELDPDTAIPSRENSSHFDADAAAAVKAEMEDSYLDLDSVPAYAIDNSVLRGTPLPAEQDRQSSVVHHRSYADELDDASRFSSPMDFRDVPDKQSDGLGISNREVFSTPMEEPIPAASNEDPSLRFLSGFLGKDDYDFGLGSYMSDSAGVSKPVPTLRPTSQDETPRVSPVEDVRAPLEPSPDVPNDHPETPIIPERKATIKTGGKLKARPSGTPADIESMIAARRQASEEFAVPTIPDKYRQVSDDSESLRSHASVSETSQQSKYDSAHGDSRRPSKIDTEPLSLDIPTPQLDQSAGFSLSEEMERIYEGQKKGYLMRQNTKVVVATNRNFSNESKESKDSNESSSSTTTSKLPGSRSANSSPRKPSEKFISTEPWVGKARRKSQRHSLAKGPAPPLPGQESVLGAVDECSTLDDGDDEKERGRLFVKVVSAKHLELPLPKNDRLFFKLTLDNGLHCVTTANFELGSNPAMGQEFELVVMNDLEFQLTLNTKLPAPPKETAAPASPTKAPRSPTKSAFSRFLSSPKKRAEKERKEREEAEQAERKRQEEERKRRALRPTPWDKLRELVDANTGSFARAYISLKQHETQCFGRQFTVDVPLYNEWALEQDAGVVSSVRSKRQNANMGSRNGVIRRPPYLIGQLELQLMYVPKPKDAKDEDMPASMSAALREIKTADQVVSTKWEGYLSQQGGDCPYWRRRFFRLSGTKLTAYHEHTHQPRATINLTKASKLIDDKTSLVADPVSGNPSAKKRRKSAFAEEDEGYQFVEEGFRIRFSNGETIDFYASDRLDKDDWMAALSKAVGKPSGSSASSSKWTDLVIARETATGNSPTKGKNSTVFEGNPEINIQPPSREASTSTHSKSVPSSPVKTNIPISKKPVATKQSAPAVPPKDFSTPSTRKPETPPLSPRSTFQDRSAIRSMIF